MKVMKSLFACLLIAALATMIGCATQPSMSQEQLLGKNEKLATLNSALKQAKTNDAELLAAESYARASNALSRALYAARHNSMEVADRASSEGLEAIKKLKRDTNTSREVLAEVLLARDNAYKAGAATLPGNKVTELDDDLRRTATWIEDGNIEKAKKRRPALLSDYNKVHLAALKQNTMKLAKTAIEDAKAQRADKYAPKTLTQAEEEMKLAITILDADRSQTVKANKHAGKAKALAEQSAAIAETVKDFNRRDYSLEDIVLWHQKYLQTINEPLGKPLALNQSSDKLVQDLRAAVALAIDEKNMTLSQLRETEQLSQVQQESAEKRIAVLKSASEKQKQKEFEEQQKFEVVQAMFTGDEANVYRQRKNVLISVHGFQFPSGQSEIQADNFPLMNKIIRAINTFPNAYIEVVGHTDSMGNDVTNQTLSESRAEKVAKFLNEVGQIESRRIISRGYGESRPVASNETREGRAENRRVEIKIVNE